MRVDEQVVAFEWLYEDHGDIRLCTCGSEVSPDGEIIDTLNFHNLASWIDEFQFVLRVRCAIRHSGALSHEVLMTLTDERVGWRERRLIRPHVLGGDRARDTEDRERVGV